MKEQMGTKLKDILALVKNPKTDSVVVLQPILGQCGPTGEVTVFIRSYMDVVEMMTLYDQVASNLTPFGVKGKENAGCNTFQTFKKAYCTLALTQALTRKLPEGTTDRAPSLRTLLRLVQFDMAEGPVQRLVAGYCPELKPDLAPDPAPVPPPITDVGSELQNMMP